MAEQEATNGQKTAPSPPYVSYTTFVNFLDWLKEVDVPAQLDRSTWSHKFSGATQSQLIVALRFLDLIDQKNVPKAALEELVKADREKRKGILRSLIAKSYVQFSDLDMSKATQGQLNERLKQSGIDGGTLEKALSFFVKAAKASDIDLSTHLTKRRARVAGRASGTRKKPPVVDHPAQATPALASSIQHVGENTLLRGLLEKIPSGEVWPKQDREKWFATARTSST